jgi:hypothetical protein
MKEKETQGEPKDSWNARVFTSIAGEFDHLVRSKYRNEKGTTISAACLLFLLVGEQVRNRVVDLVKLAEGRGYDGPMLRAAQKEWDEMGYRLLTREDLKAMLQTINGSLAEQRRKERPPESPDVES